MSSFRGESIRFSWVQEYRAGSGRDFAGTLEVPTLIQGLQCHGHTSIYNHPIDASQDFLVGTTLARPERIFTARYDRGIPCAAERVAWHPNRNLGEGTLAESFDLLPDLRFPAGSHFELTEEGWLKAVTLSRDLTIGNYTFAARTRLGFCQIEGQTRFGSAYFEVPHTFDGITVPHGSASFDQGQFSDASVSDGHILSDRQNTFQGPCEVHFCRREGQPLYVSWARLTKPQQVGRFNCNPGIIFVRENGQPNHFTLADGVTFNIGFVSGGSHVSLFEESDNVAEVPRNDAGPLCFDNKTFASRVVFHSTGKPKEGKLASPQSIQVGSERVLCAAEKAVFHENGELHTATLAHDTIIQNVPCRGGKVIAFDDTGKLQYATLSQPYTVPETIIPPLPADTRVSFPKPMYYLSFTLPDDAPPMIICNVEVFGGENVSYRCAFDSGERHIEASVSVNVKITRQYGPYSLTGNITYNSDGEPCGGHLAEDTTIHLAHGVNLPAKKWQAVRFEARQEWDSTKQVWVKKGRYLSRVDASQHVMVGTQSVEAKDAPTTYIFIGRHRFPQNAGYTINAQNELVAYQYAQPVRVWNRYTAKPDRPIWLNPETLDTTGFTLEGPHTVDDIPLPDNTCIGFSQHSWRAGIPVSSSPDATETSSIPYTYVIGEITASPRTLPAAGTVEYGENVDIDYSNGWAATHAIRIGELQFTKPVAVRIRNAGQEYEITLPEDATVLGRSLPADTWIHVRNQQLIEAYQSHIGGLALPEPTMVTFGDEYDSAAVEGKIGDIPVTRTHPVVLRKNGEVEVTCGRALKPGEPQPFDLPLQPQDTVVFEQGVPTRAYLNHPAKICRKDYTGPTTISLSPAGKVQKVEGETKAGYSIDTFDDQGRVVEIILDKDLAWNQIFTFAQGFPIQLQYPPADQKPHLKRAKLAKTPTPPITFARRPVVAGDTIEWDEQGQIVNVTPDDAPVSPDPSV